MRKTILKVITLLAIPFAMVGLSSGDTYADVSTIPEDQPFTDINFYNCVVETIGRREAVSEETGPTDEQLRAIERLYCNGTNKPDEEKITSAVGIEKMTALTDLGLQYNKLTSVDLTNNVMLENINIVHNQLTSINLPHTTTLTFLGLNNNLLNSIDLSYNTALRALNLDYNQLVSIDLSKNTALTFVDLTSNKISSIDLSNNTSLSGLWFQNNQLTSIDLSHNTALTQLLLNLNQLSKIDLSHNTALAELHIHGNQLTSVDLSHNTAIEDLRVDDIFVKTWITRSEVNGNTEFDLSSLKFFISEISEGEGYLFNNETNILTVENPLATRYVQAELHNKRFRNYKLVLYEEPTPTPTTDSDEGDIKVPDTGTITGTEGGALAIFTVTTFVILSAIAVAGIHKKHASGHFKYDK